MPKVKSWDPEAQVRYLLARTIDLESYQWELKRRKRAACPSPEASRMVDSVIDKDVRNLKPMAFQAINKPAVRRLTESAAVRDVAMSKALDRSEDKLTLSRSRLSIWQQPHESGANSRLTPEKSPTPPELPERDWGMRKIKEKRSVLGVIERLLEWRDSMVPSSVITTNERGQCFVAVAGREWEVIERTLLKEVDPKDGAKERVKWKDTWQPDWELPQKAVAQFEADVGKVEKKKQEEPQWWTFTEFHHLYLAPEAEPAPGTRGELSLEPFEPEADVDYTISFLEQVREKLARDSTRLAHSTIRRFLNMRIRQRLRFPATMLLEGFLYPFESDDFIRIVLVYIFGRAGIHPCLDCKDRKGPLPKCVTWELNLAQACSNCAFRAKGPDCAYHGQNRHQEVPQLADQAVIDAVTANGEGEVQDPNLSSSPPRSQAIHDIAMRSSVSREEDLSMLTPPSSHIELDEALFNSIPEFPLDMPSPDRGDGIPGPDFDLFADDPVVSKDTAIVTGPRLNVVSQSNDFIPVVDLTGDAMRQEGVVVGTDNFTFHPKREMTETDTDQPTIKRQRHDSPFTIVNHPNCDPKPNAPCTDALAGAELRAYSSPLVWGTKRFAASEATDEQVNYILSCSDCEGTEKFRHYWENVKKWKMERGERIRWPNRFRYISERMVDHLNLMVERFCPWPDHGKTIDLTEE